MSDAVGGSRDSDVRRLIFWNRVMLAIAVLAVAALFGQFAIRYADGVTYEVSTWWDGDSLRCSTIRGPLYITHLMGYDGTTPIAARLPAPVFILDSKAAEWLGADLAKLKWRDEGGGEHPRPVAGTRMRALYVRLEQSEWRDKKADQ